MLTDSKFWTRNRLGDRMRDKYNLNILDTEDDVGEFFLFYVVVVVIWLYVYLFLVWLLVVFQKLLG